MLLEDIRELVIQIVKSDWSFPKLSNNICEHLPERRWAGIHLVFSKLRATSFHLAFFKLMCRRNWMDAQPRWLYVQWLVVPKAPQAGSSTNTEVTPSSGYCCMTEILQLAANTPLDHKAYILFHTGFSKTALRIESSKLREKNTSCLP